MLFFDESHLLIYIHRLTQGLLPVKGLDESDTQWDVLLAIKMDHERESPPDLLNFSYFSPETSLFFSKNMCKR